MPALSAAYAAVGGEQVAVANAGITIVQQLGSPVATTVTVTVTATVRSLTIPHGALSDYRACLPPSSWPRSS